MTETALRDGANVEEHTPGRFWWADLATTDLASAKQFYNALFGWVYTDNPVSDDGVYSMAQLGDGLAICGMYEQDAQIQRDQGPHWLSYVSVDDIAARASDVSRLGGTLLGEPYDVAGVGQMAVATDPSGAVFAMWQKGEHGGADLVNVPGALTWNDLATSDAAAAKRFYGGLLGWTVDQQMSDDYSVMALNGSSVCGVMQMDAEWSGIPPHWSVYFAVEDCDESCALIRKLGGKVEVEPSTIDGVGRFAIVKDPQGVLFAIIALEPPPES